MTSIRLGLRLAATIWLGLQVVSLSALVPRDCCAAHRRAVKSAEPACHRAAAAVQCPMRAADGTPCPMHRGAGASDAHQSSDCAVRGSCSGPMAPLLAQLSNYGILTDVFHLHPDVYAESSGAVAREQLVTRLSPPDTPPPRA